MHATNVCTRTLAAHAQQFGTRSFIDDHVSSDSRANRQMASSNESPVEDDHLIFCLFVCTRTLATHAQQFVLFYFAADIAVAMLESEEKVRKRRREVWSLIILKVSFSVWSAICDVSV